MVFFFKQKTAYELRISDWSSDVCSSDLVAFVRGASEAINLVAYSHPRKGRVLLSTLEHHSNIVPWQLAGWQVDVCPLTVDGRIDLDAAEKMLTPDHTMVAFAQDRKSTRLNSSH